MTPSSEYHDPFRLLGLWPASSVSKQCNEDPVGVPQAEEEDHPSWSSFAMDLCHAEEAIMTHHSSHSFPPTPMQSLLHTSDMMTEYFFQQFCMPNTWLAGLPQLYSGSHEKTALRHAMHVASMFLTGNQTGDYTAAETARSSYSRSLKLLNAALGDPVEKSKDETICAALVLHLVAVSQDSRKDKISIERG